MIETPTFWVNPLIRMKIIFFLHEGVRHWELKVYWKDEGELVLYSDHPNDRNTVCT